MQNNDKNLRQNNIVSVKFKLSSVRRDENGKVEIVTYIDDNGNYLHLRAEFSNSYTIEVRFKDTYINLRKNCEIINRMIQSITPLDDKIIEEETPKIEYSIPSFVVNSEVEPILNQEVFIEEETIATEKDNSRYVIGARKREEARKNTREQLETAIGKIVVLESRINELNKTLLEKTREYMEQINEAELAKKLLNGEIEGIDVVVYKNKNS